MHVNNQRPNILQDKIAGATRDLRDRDRHGMLTAKRWILNPVRGLGYNRVYPYSSERQNTRLQRKAEREA
jgi:hypothetical protein